MCEAAMLDAVETKAIDDRRRVLALEVPDRAAGMIHQEPANEAVLVPQALRTSAIGDQQQARVFNGARRKDRDLRANAYPLAVNAGRFERLERPARLVRVDPSNGRIDENAHIGGVQGDEFSTKPQYIPMIDARAGELPKP